MAVDSVVFPLLLEEVSSTPEFNTTIISLGNGSEQRIGNWLDAKSTINAALGVRSLADLTTLIKFFRARKGPLRGFLYKDMIDNSVTGQAFGTGNGSQVAFQLIKEYSDSGNTDTKIIHKPISGTVQIYKGVTLQTVTTDYTIDYSTGIVTFVVAPTGGMTPQIVSWTGQFYLVLRFAEDKLPAPDMYFDIQEGRSAGDLNSVPMVEINEY